MSRIVVEAPGLFSTVQDLGREGFGPLGISASGAADPISLRLGNLLVGNSQRAAGIEMTITGGSFAFPEGALIAVTGSDFCGVVNDKRVVPFTSNRLPPGSMLRFGATTSGARAYLCVRGGVAVPLFLGSASTHALSGLGGFLGRPLKKGDSLAIGEGTENAQERKINPSILRQFAPRKTLRVTAGPQENQFSETARGDFYASTYRVTVDSNRVGLRLLGAPVHVNSAGEMITEGVSLGAIQVTPEGQPIIVFVEQQTTGGYPKIANVIAADLPSVGQLRPQDEIRFKKVSWQTSRRLLATREGYLCWRELVL